MADSGDTAAAPRIVFFGWGAAAAQGLRAIPTVLPAARVLVLSHPDQASDAPLDEIARELGYEAALTDDAAEIERMAREFAPTLILSSSYRKKLSAAVLGLCADALNFHPSLLPKHRGCFSGFWSIFEGDQETGVTCHRMVERFDEGHIIHQERIPLFNDETSHTIYRKLLPVTAECVANVLKLVASGPLPEGAEQKPGEGSYHFRKLPFGGQIQPEWDDVSSERFIRAMLFPGFKGAVAIIDGKEVEVRSLADLKAARGEAAADVARGSEEQPIAVVGG